MDSSNDYINDVNLDVFNEREWIIDEYEDICVICNSDIKDYYRIFIKDACVHDVVCEVCIKLYETNLYEKIKYPLMLTTRLVDENIIDIDIRIHLINILKKLKY